jgi:hypothetical protein
MDHLDGTAGEGGVLLGRASGDDAIGLRRGVCGGEKNLSCGECAEGVDRS